VSPEDRTSRARQRRASPTCRPDASHFGIDATVIGQISGPRVTRYELQLARHEGVEGRRPEGRPDTLATTEIHILAPIPGKRAVGVEIEPLPEPRPLGDIFDEGARPRRARSGVARQDLGAAV
jgi:DNA segregation ATPase FtsK/SpoIIIE-like protein